MWDLLDAKMTRGQRASVHRSRERARPREPTPAARHVKAREGATSSGLTVSNDFSEWVGEFADTDPAGPGDREHVVSEKELKASRRFIPSSSERPPEYLHGVRPQE